jgi:hypothetical protein
MVNIDKNILEKFFSQLKQYALSESRILSSILALSMFLCMLLYTLQRSYNPFVHDSAYYWNLAGSFVVNGDFSIINFHNELRGYLFPFLLFVIKTLAALLHIDGKTLFYIFSSLFFTALSVYILPWFTNTLLGWNKHLIGRALLGILIFFFWRGHFLYPLSDFPGLASLLLGTTFIVKSLRKPFNRYYSALAGLFLSAASNIRPIYLISLLILLISGLIIISKSKRLLIFQWLALFILGSCIVLIPQYQINNKYLDRKSPLVQAKYDNENWYIKGLFWGLGTQKFETNIGDNFPSIVVIYEDPFKSKIQKTNILRNKDISGYLRIVKNYPADIAVSYFRHLFNGLDIFFPTPYIKNLFANHIFLSIVNYLIWLLIIYHLVNMDLSHISLITTAGVMSMISPVILSIPIVIEIRYFLPAYLMAYGVIAFGVNPKNLVKSIFQNKWQIVRIIIVCVLWLTLCFSLSAATVENLTY